MADAMIPLAWAGWHTRIPPDWRPLHIEGGWGRGRMMVGTAAEALFQFKWWRPPAGRPFDAGAWMKQRVRAMNAWEHERPPRPEGFEPVALLPEARCRGGGNRCVWYGYAPAAGLVLEAAINRAAGADVLALVRDGTVGGLRAPGRSEAVPWAVYETGFVSPAGFTLRAWRLFSGDIALLFERRRPAARLTLRQVYPAELALKRRPMERWLDAFPFEGHRRLRGQSRAAAWVRAVGASAPCAGDGRPEADRPRGAAAGAGVAAACPGTGGAPVPFPAGGLRREAWKRFLWPFGGTAARRSVAAGARDDRLGRLLLAEIDGEAEDAERMLAECIAGMNR